MDLIGNLADRLKKAPAGEQLTLSLQLLDPSLMSAPGEGRQALKQRFEALAAPLVSALKELGLSPDTSAYMGATVTIEGTPEQLRQALDLEVVKAMRGKVRESFLDDRTLDVG